MSDCNIGKGEVKLETMDAKIPKKVKDILNKIRAAGFQAFIVGGAVRDLISEKDVKDWDFTTDAKPEEILKIFPDGFYDNKFGTVGIPVNSTSKGRESKGLSSKPTFEGYEITTMRKEGVYKDHRHPVEVGWTDHIEEDLARRDFTINAIAFTPYPLPFAIVDPFNGQQDIKDKIIRCVGDPNTRFQEDALRLIRAIRFAAQLEFKLDEKTFSAIKQNAKLIKEIAYERIRDELFKILASDNPYSGINKLREAGILQIILPELERCFGLSQEGPKHDRVYDIGEHSLLALKTCPSKGPLVKLAALLHDIGKPDTVCIQKDKNVTFYNHDFVGGKIILNIARRFNLSNKQTDKLFKLVRWHMFTLDENQTDSAIRRFIKNIGVENIEDMLAVRIADRLGGGTQTAVSWRMKKFKDRITQVLQKPFSIADLKINGRDVMETLNIKPGKKVGEILQKLFDEVLEDSSKNTRKYLLKKVSLVT